MPKKLLKKYLPHPRWAKEHPRLQWLGKYLTEPGLWHFSHRSVSLGCFIGVFCCFLPMPFQMLPAAILAIFFGANLLVTLACVWISNPVTMPAMVYFSYQVGIWILDISPPPYGTTWGADQLYHYVKFIGAPIMLGSLVCGLVFGCIAFLMVRVIWNFQVRRAWKNRSRLRKP